MNTMGTTRLEAFSDGVLAIIITIMVLELKVPHGAGMAELLPLWPVLLSYILSFIYVGIYWNNHHHMLTATEHVSAGIMWANLHLLFWLSLIPFVTGWMGENHFAPLPCAMYGVVLFMAAGAYVLMQTTIIRTHGKNSLLAKAIGHSDVKGKISPVLYMVGIVSSFFCPLVALLVYGLVALMWLLPDRRIEKTITKKGR